MPLLEITNLHSGYGKLAAVHGVNLHVNSAEIVGLVGVNGAGKSTLLKTVYRLLKPTDGTVVFDGHDLASHSPRDVAKLGLGYVPQGRNTFPPLTVEANLRVSLSAMSADVDAGLSRAYELFPKLGDRRKQTAGTLSGGERQMLALASAMVSRPKMLVLDEPTVGLAPLIVKDLIERISDARGRGATILWVVEENPFEVLRRCDRVYVMDGGTVVHEMPGGEQLDEQEMHGLFFGSRA